MDRASDNPAHNFGLLANGSSRLWDVDIDEALDGGGGWSMQLDGPHVYLDFQLRDLGVVSEMIRFLQAPPAGGPQRDRPARPEPSAEFILGKFGAAPVSLVWDDQGSPICYLIITPNTISALRLNLWGEDIPMLLEALRQVAKDLPPRDPENRA
jgi:hypothetical protein